MTAIEFNIAALFCIGTSCLMDTTVDAQKTSYIVKYERQDSMKLRYESHKQWVLEELFWESKLSEFLMNDIRKAPLLNLRSRIDSLVKLVELEDFSNFLGKSVEDVDRHWWNHNSLLQSIESEMVWMMTDVEYEEFRRRRMSSASWRHPPCVFPEFPDYGIEQDTTLNKYKIEKLPIRGPAFLPKPSLDSLRIVPDHKSKYNKS